MALAIEWLDSAKTDLRDILDYIAHDRPMAAAGYVAAISEAVLRLADFPESGRRYDSVYRVLVVKQHLVVYRYFPDVDKVLLVAVFDGRRDLAKLIKSLPH